MDEARVNTVERTVALPSVIAPKAKPSVCICAARYTTLTVMLILAGKPCTQGG